MVDLVTMSVTEVEMIFLITMHLHHKRVIVERLWRRWCQNGQSTGGNGLQFPNFIGPLIGQPSLNPYNGYFNGGGGSGKRMAIGYYSNER